VIERSRVRFPAGALPGSLGQLSLHPSGVGKSRVPADWMGLRQGVFTCVGWQVTLCDLIWQVLLCDGIHLIKSYMLLRVPTPPGKSWIFCLKFKDPESPGKSLFPGESWKLKFKVLESPGKISLKIMRH